jgi:protein-S-isoprenylcysteine O-methyltransferase Ste14
MNSALISQLKQILMNMNTVSLKIVFMICLVTIYSIRFSYQRRNKNNSIIIDKKTSLEKFVLFLTSIGMLFLPVIYVLTPFLEFANYRLPIWANITGIFVFLMGIWMFWRSHDDLGINWSPTLEVREGHTLITNGIYQKIRHPMYTSIWLWVIAQALLLDNWLAGFSGIISYGILYFARINNEEQMMIEQFGEKYQIYMENTRRLLPKLRRIEL